MALLLPLALLYCSQAGLLALVAVVWPVRLPWDGALHGLTLWLAVRGNSEVCAAPLLQHPIASWWATFTARPAGRPCCCPCRWRRRSAARLPARCECLLDALQLVGGACCRWRRSRCARPERSRGRLPRRWLSLGSARSSVRRWRRRAADRAASTAGCCRRSSASGAWVACPRRCAAGRLLVWHGSSWWQVCMLEPQAAPAAAGRLLRLESCEQLYLLRRPMVAAARVGLHDLTRRWLSRQQEPSTFSLYQFGLYVSSTHAMASAACLRDCSAYGGSLESQLFRPLPCSRPRLVHHSCPFTFFSASFNLKTAF